MGAASCGDRRCEIAFHRIRLDAYRIDIGSKPGNTEGCGGVDRPVCRSCGVTLDAGHILYDCRNNWREREYLRSATEGPLCADFSPMLPLLQSLVAGACQ